MLGLIPLIFIGRYYYQLAHEYNRARWGFAFLGVGIAIAAQVLFAFGAGMLAGLTGNLQWINNGAIVLTLMAIGFAVIVVIVVYKLLENNWKKVPKDKTNHELLDR